MDEIAEKVRRSASEFVEKQSPDASAETKLVLTQVVVDTMMSLITDYREYDRIWDKVFLYGRDANLTEAEQQILKKYGDDSWERIMSGKGFLRGLNEMINTGYK